MSGRHGSRVNRHISNKVSTIDQWTLVGQGWLCLLTDPHMKQLKGLLLVTCWRSLGMFINTNAAKWSNKKRQKWGKSSNHWVRSTFGRDEQLIGMLNKKLLRIETNVQNMGQSLPRKESGSDWHWLIMNLSFGLLSLPSRVKRNVKSLN
jgi:hypothetical protein